MWSDKLRQVREFIVKHSKIIFPVVVVVLVAVTVTVALNSGDPNEALELPKEEISADDTTAQDTGTEDTEILMSLNEDQAVTTLIMTYYNSVALGDEETLRSICDEVSDKDMLRYVETSKYIEKYPLIEIYTKPGLEEGTTIAYVYYKVTFEGVEAEFPGYQAHFICTDAQGNLYFKRTDNSAEVNDYIIEVSAQADVVDFNNRINVEYNDLISARPDLLEYLSELDSQVSTAVGEGLAQLAAAEQDGEDAASGDGQEDGDPEGGGSEETVRYGIASTTVNVRSSDSEQAEKLGKVSEGTKLQILEQQLNGWTKVLFENKEGFIKSEYLQPAESADGAVVIGTVTAITNINVRAAANQNAEKLGVLTGGDSAELIANENGWCKIKYDGQIGYVKADYVQ